VDSNHVSSKTVPMRCGETNVPYGPDLGRESTYGSPSSRMIWRRSLCACLVVRACEDGGCPPCRPPLGGEGGAVALSFVRVGACADELRLMGVERSGLPSDAGGAGGNEGSLTRKSSRACVPPAMNRMWKSPWGSGANWTMRFMESGGRLTDRRYSLVGCLVATNGGRS
jgi:hypothetical protein